MSAANRLIRAGQLAARSSVAFWRSVRPRTRRGAMLAGAAIAGGATVLAVALVAAAGMAWSPYLESAVRPEANPQAWAALQPVYSDAGSCRECHATEAARAASAAHAGIGCESCHGALPDHALASPGTSVATSLIAVPTDDLCVRCHTTTLGRPVAVHQITSAEHYVPFCLQCHDPHTAISRRPPVVLHPLENLPPCITCHGPDGFKARNQRHPVVADDERCLDCHAPGRGPEDD